MVPVGIAVSLRYAKCLDNPRRFEDRSMSGRMKPRWRNSGPDALGVSSASVGSDGSEVKESANAVVAGHVMALRC